MLSKKTTKKLKNYIKLRSLFWIAGFLLTATYVMATYIYIPNALNFATSNYAEKLNIDLVTDGWSVDWTDAKFATENLIINTDMSHEPLARIPEISVDFSIWRMITGGWKQAINAMNIDRPELYLERNRAGSWNWEDIFGNRHIAELVDQTITISSEELQPANGDSDLNIQRVNVITANNGTQGNNSSQEPEPATPVILDKIRITGMKINWVEALRGQSSGSVVTESKATIHIDDGNFTITNVRWPFDANAADGQQLKFDGRLGGGRVSLAAQGNVLSWVGPDHASGYQFQEPLWNPEISGRMALDNVGADSLSGLIPEPKIVATRGTMSGDTQFKLVDGRLLAMSANIDMHNVQYATIEAATNNQRAQSRMVIEANGFASSKFEGDLLNEDFRPLSLLLASVAEDSMRSADPKIQLLAAQQTARLQKGLTADSQQRMHDQRPASIQAAVGSVIGLRLNEKLDGALGEHGAEFVGGMAAEALTDADEGSGGSAVGTAVKGTGKAIGNAGKKTWGWIKNIGKKE